MATISGALIRLLRGLLRIAPPAIGPAEAIEAARAEAMRRDLPWLEPIEVWPRLRHYVVRTHAGFIGGGCLWVHVDTRTGSVTRMVGPLSR